MDLLRDYFVDVASIDKNVSRDFTWDLSHEHGSKVAYIARVPVITFRPYQFHIDLVVQLNGFAALSRLEVRGVVGVTGMPPT